MTYRCQKLAPLTVAALTIVAMFLAPLCGILCGAPTHCAPQSAIGHAGAEDCHHFAMSAESSAADLSPTAATNCAQPETVAILLDAAKKQLSPPGLLAAAQSVATTATNATSFACDAGDAPLTETRAILLKSASTILRT
jgi:hypothetical protein